MFTRARRRLRLSIRGRFRDETRRNVGFVRGTPLLQMSDFDSLSYIIYVSDLCTMSYENYVFILYRGMIFILYTPRETRKTPGKTRFSRGKPLATALLFDRVVRSRRPAHVDGRMLRAAVRARGLVVRTRTHGIVSGSSSSRGAVLRAHQQQQQQYNRRVATTTRAMSRFGDVPEAPKVRE